MGPCRFIAALLFLAGALAAASAPVIITEDDKEFTLANGSLTAHISKTTGDLNSLRFNGLEMMGYVSGHHAGYWEQNPAKAAQLTATVTINPVSNGGSRGEVSIKGISGGKRLDGGLQPGGSMVCDLEIRYTLGRDEPGLYTYAIFSHQPSYPATQIGESRFGVKLNAKVFDWMTIDARRNKRMPTGADWDQGAELNMKEARRLTTGRYAGQVEHKYDYSAVQFDIPAFGWASTTQHIGFYFINPSMEYLSGGATKVELTGHLDDGKGGDPTLLDYWRGTHYGGSVLTLADGENWSKVVGPIFLYLNQASDPNAAYRDALAQAAKEAAKWPYDWVEGVDYPMRAQRGTVSGQLVLNDAPKRMPHLLVGLACPDDDRVTWQNDAKHYEFWVRGTEDGRFSIPNVRPGTYELHAIADGVLGEFARGEIKVPAGGRVDLGKLDWKPVHYGRQLWEIGVPNRSGAEFFKGDEYFRWGWYLEYPRLFPQGVDFTIGKSDYRKDWFFEQVPHSPQSDASGRGNGDSTTWTIHFNLPDAPRGRATLRLALSGVSAKSIEVAVNGRHAGTVDSLVYNATINRDGIAGAWVEKDVAFDASMMKSGANIITLTVPAGSLTSGIIYDYLRLELDEGSPP
jgi:rhamnogalacturonan endolyase